MRHLPIHEKQKGEKEKAVKEKPKQKFISEVWKCKGNIEKT